MLGWFRSGGPLGFHVEPDPEIPGFRVRVPVAFGIGDPSEADSEGRLEPTWLAPRSDELGFLLGMPQPARVPTPPAPFDPEAGDENGLTTYRLALPGLAPVGQDPGAPPVMALPPALLLDNLARRSAPPQSPRPNWSPWWPPTRPQITPAPVLAAPIVRPPARPMSAMPTVLAPLPRPTVASPSISTPSIPPLPASRIPVPIAPEAGLVAGADAVRPPPSAELVSEPPPPAQQDTSAIAATPPPSPSLAERMLEAGVKTLVPGAHYAALAQSEREAGNAFRAAVYHLASMLEAGLAVGTLGASVPILATTRAATTAGAALFRRSFQSLSRLRQYLGKPPPGMQWHHIVEQSQIPQFGRERIHSIENVVALPQDIHLKLSSLYSSIQPATRPQTVRGWLSTKSFDEQYEYGMTTIARTLGY